MFDNPETSSYFIVKAMEGLILCSDIETEFTNLGDIIGIDNIDLLPIFKEVVQIYAGMMDQDMKNNIYYVLDYYKNLFSGEARKQVYSIANEIIGIVNMSNDKAQNDFIQEQLVERYAANKRDIARGMASKEYTLGYLKENMVDDVYILETHSHIYSDEEFEAVIPQITDVESDYLGSINYMLIENPDLCKEPVFISRVKRCARLYEENVRNYHGSDEPIDIKLAKKMIKAYKKEAKKFN